ncbi:MAG TPA: hypothetical protein VL947_04605 [Cytophagales bacterium]|nr:hypothetical protein [Cytophagales bacterium]
MSEIVSYERSNLTMRGKNQVVIGDVTKFAELPLQNLKPDKQKIKSAVFESFHHITGTSNQVILTAYNSKQLPEVMFMSWSDFPYLHHVEQGGDLLLQEISKHHYKYVLIDNTYVKSGWMNDKVAQYSDAILYPALVECGLKGFGHIPSQGMLGAKSFEEFKKTTQNYLDHIAAKLHKPCFKYVPVILSEELGKTDKPAMRQQALEEGIDKLLSIV